MSSPTDYKRVQNRGHQITVSRRDRQTEFVKWIANARTVQSRPLFLLVHGPAMQSVSHVTTFHLTQVLRIYSLPSSNSDCWRSLLNFHPGGPRIRSGTGLPYLYFVIYLRVWRYRTAPFNLYLMIPIHPSYLPGKTNQVIPISIPGQHILKPPRNYWSASDNYNHIPNPRHEYERAVIRDRISSHINI